MVIRCERCSTLYELDEKVLSSSGSQVQCTRCQHVFTAHPPTAPGRTLVGVPAQPSPPQPAASRSAAPSGPRPPAATPSPNGAARAVRSGPAPVYRPTPPAQGAPAGGAAVRAPLLRKDTVGAFESRLRWSARWRWLGPLAVAVAVVGGGVAWLLLSGRVDPEVSRAREEAIALVARDDGESVGKAIVRLDGAARSGASTAALEADRALAKVVRAAGLVEEGESVPELAKEREAEARALATEAYEALRALQAGEGSGAEVARALAAYYALGGDRERAQRAIRGGAERAPADPWLALADAWLDARGTDRAARERALVKLGGLSASRPELLRARWLLARTQASLGRRSEALSTLEGLLAVNGKHEGARRLRSELAGAPAPAASAAPAAAPSTAPPTAPPGAPATTIPAPPRKRPPPAPAPEPTPAAAPDAGAEALPVQVLTPVAPPAQEPAAAPESEAKPPPAEPPPRPKRQPPPEPPPLEGQ